VGGSRNGRRNLSDYQKSYLRGKRYLTEKKGHGGDRKSSAQNAHLTSTSETLAEEYDTSEKTIRRDADFATAVDTIAENCGPDASDGRGAARAGRLRGRLGFLT